MMTRMQVYIPDQMFAQLKYKARIKNIPMSELVRRGLDKVLNSNKRKKPKKFGEGFIGAGGKGGPKDVSSKIDYYLYGEGSKWADKY